MDLGREIEAKILHVYVSLPCRQFSSSSFPGISYVCAFVMPFVGDLYVVFFFLFPGGGQVEFAALRKDGFSGSFSRDFPTGLSAANDGDCPMMCCLQGGDERRDGRMGEMRGVRDCSQHL